MSLLKRTWLAALILLILSYVTCYSVLATRGRSEARLYDLDGFLYVSLPDFPSQPTEEQREAIYRKLRLHYALSILFLPINVLDRTILGGDGPILGIMWELS